MRCNTAFLAIGLVFTGVSLAIPTDDLEFINFLSKRNVVSPDNSCGLLFAGANNSYTCTGNNLAGGGPCCSQYGYCGNTTDYCGTGCQTSFGICRATPVQPTYSDSICGANNNNDLCNSGLCCSTNGFCGNTTDYCGAGCQSTFGDCSSILPAPSGGNCGPNFGGAVCSSNQCCSMAGYCGSTSDFCADPGNCMLGFGRCDSDTTPLGPSTQSAPRPLLGSVSYADDIFDCVQNNVVALSYDDGPYNYTSQLLDTLKSYGFKATFFITGNNNGKGEIDTTAPYPALIQRMITEGHQVASHTWSHYSLSNISQALRISQMVKNEMAFNNIIGKWPTYMRPPYSDCTAASGCQADLLALGYHRVYFDLDTQDYLNPSPTQITNSVNIVKAALNSQYLKTNAITDYLSIQHDIVQQSVVTLSPAYFNAISALGWKGVTVGTCLGDPEVNWYRTLSGTSAAGPIGSSSSSSTRAATSTSKTPSTSKSTSTSKPPSTSTSTSATAPTSTCEFTNRSWCGNISKFTTKSQCTTAYTTCLAAYTKCLLAGLTSPVCTTWNGICGKLGMYCAACKTGGTCSNAGFGY